MVEPLRPARGGFLRPFGYGWFIREFLMGHGPNGSPKIDPSVGAPQSDICYHCKKALPKAIGVDRTIRQEERQGKRERRPISPGGIERLATRYVLQTPYKSSGCRYHSCVVYFSNLQRLDWVEESGKEERSAFQNNYPRGYPRKFFRHTEAGGAACDAAWGNLLLALYDS